MLLLLHSAIVGYTFRPFSGPPSDLYRTQELYISSLGRATCPYNKHSRTLNINSIRISNNVESLN